MAVLMNLDSNALYAALVQSNNTSPPQFRTAHDLLQIDHVL